MPTRLSYAFAATPGGAVVASQSDLVDVYSHDGDSVLTADIDTDGEGLWSWTFVPSGSAGAGWVIDPGPIYWIGSYNGRVRRGSSKSGGAVGPNSLLELPNLWAAWGDGVVLGQLDGFAVTYDAAGLDVDIAAGKYNLDGQLVTLPLTKELTVTTANGTHPRIDRVILERVRTAGDTEGKVTLKMLDGTAAASPVPTALTDSATTLQVSLAQVRVNATSTTVTSVTDERTYTVSSVSRSPNLSNIARISSGAALSTTPASIAALEVAVTLVSGAWYDILVTVDLTVDGASSVAMLSPFINGTGNAADYVSAPAQASYVSVGNAHTLAVLGTGAAITSGVLAKRSGTTNAVNYTTGTCRVLAVPRS